VSSRHDGTASASGQFDIPQLQPHARHTQCWLSDLQFSLTVGIGCHNRAAVAAMRGSGWSVAGQPFHDFNQNVISYSGPGYHTAVGTAHNTFYPLVAAAAGLTALGRTDMVPTVAAYTAAAAGLLGPAPTINLAGATSFVTASQTAMPAPSYGLPLDLVNVKSNLQGASAAYTALGSPPEQVSCSRTTRAPIVRATSLHCAVRVTELVK
jgi:hypothetical protein